MKTPSLDLGSVGLETGDVIFLAAVAILMLPLVTVVLACAYMELCREVTMRDRDALLGH